MLVTKIHNIPLFEGCNRFYKLQNTVDSHHIKLLGPVKMLYWGFEHNKIQWSLERWDLKVMVKYQCSIYWFHCMWLGVQNLNNK